MGEPTMNERYDVLDGNGGVLHSTNLWWEACQVLRNWRGPGYYGTTDEGSIRDNESEN